MAEVWKDVPNYEGYYQASNKGNLRSLDRVEKYIHLGKEVQRKRNGRAMKPKVTKDGYYEIQLIKKSKPEHIRLHRIVLYTFNPIADVETMQVNHKDGKKLNNDLSNLEWVTHQENKQHAYNTGLEDPVGINNANARTTEEQVIQTRRLKNKGYKYREIEKIVGIPKSRIKAICNSWTWKHLPSCEELKLID